MCKTPVVYFKETAVEDICENKVIGGYGAEYRNSKDLAEGIKWISDTKNYNVSLVNKAREKILKNFNSEILTNKYIDLYNSVIK